MQVRKRLLFLHGDLALSLMQKKLPSGVGLLAAVASFSTVEAVDPSTFLLYQKGPVALKPQLTVSETFNDNVSYRRDNKESDFITVLSPGLVLQVGRKDFNFLEFSYTYDRYIYADLNEFDANQHHIASRLKFQKNRLTLDGRDTIDFLSSPLGGGYSSGSTSGTEGVIVGGRKVDRTAFADSYRLTWDASERSDLYLGLGHSFWDYEEDLALYDSRTLIGTLGFEYHPFTKAFFFGETYFGETQNDRNVEALSEYPTANFVGMFVGTRGNFTEKLRGMAKAGFEHRYYSDGGDPLTTPVVEMSLAATLTENTELNAGYSRHQYESIQFVRSSYTTDSLSFSWLQKIGADGRLRSLLSAGYQLSQFENNGRTDNIFNAGLTISYDIKLWMHAFGSYTFEHLDSNELLVEDYNVNRIMVGLHIGY
jgi:hypothetical protein